ncbi:MAG: class I SAM-dependent methyltransferase [Thermodesulfobacteriota bacterium]
MPGFHHPLRNGHSPEEVTEIFRRHWDIYRKVIEHDYMSHKAAYGRLHEILNDEIDWPFSFADLACGDAYWSSRSLLGTNVSEYTGIDLSEWALAIAGKELKSLPAEHRLITGDFEEFDTFMDIPPDVVWVGLSVHHLETEKKGEFMSKVRDSVPEDGIYMIYEPTLTEGEDRAAYFNRFKDVVTRTWVDLTPEELGIVFDHVKKSDLPEQPSDWIRLGREAGFRTAEEVYTDPTGLYTVFKYKHT